MSDGLKLGVGIAAGIMLFWLVLWLFFAIVGGIAVAASGK